MKNQFDLLLEQNALITSENEVKTLMIERYRQELIESNEENEVLKKNAENLKKSLFKSKKSKEQILEEMSPTKKQRKSILDKNFFEQKKDVQKKNYLLLLKKFDNELSLFRDHSTNVPLEKPILIVNESEVRKEKLRFLSQKNKKISLK